MELDALEAVRRLTMERDALANELDAVKDDFRVSLQTLDSIRAATGLHNYGPHLAKSLKTMKDERDALAEQVKRLEDSVVWHREELKRTRSEWEQQKNARRAPERRERHETGTEPTEGPNGASRGNTGPQACASCRFWLEQEVEAECPRRGDCRRCPPAPDLDSSFAAFPVTMHDCWCGEWQAK